MLSPTIWGRNCHYPHFSDEENEARETQSNKWIKVLMNRSDFLAYLHAVQIWLRQLIFSAGFAKRMAPMSSFLPSVPLLSYVKQMSLRTGGTIKPDIWKCYFPNYEKKKKGIWKDPAGERGVRTMVSTRYYLSFGLFISRKGVCESISGTYEKTSTDGKFLFHKASKLSQRGRPQFSPLLKKCLMSYALFLFAPTTVPPIFLQCYLAPLQILPSFSFSLSFFLFLSLAPTLMTLAPPCTRSSSAGFKWWAENITEFKWWFWCWG